ncbi:MAG: SPOR domain-containing protein [Methylobacter sp.]|nr:SPOR domain-containing protein [Methylobacter sp.]MDP2098338.1 SPOR domain-containing protein [Methylobacter sp.]MDP2430182.1 SPOR domain-containing protein [Methylobacter sp.]MDP3056366.1 SPOR domain-containing protein [Methylobacter sp.]MDP3363309.1 SPOR domain-containing protein [Methylobacter sp.]
MARDYKNRTQNKHTATSYRQSAGQRKSLSLWRWMLITALIISFVVFLVYLSSSGSKQSQPEQVPTPAAAKNEAAKQEKKPDLGPVLPQFDFYTILPEKEVIVPDHEINTRTREERVGQAKATSYIMQAGSFKEFKDADSLRAKLALMGIESKVEKAKVGNVVWNRVKMGPYTQMASVSTIRSRLRENGIDVLVIEVGN